MVKMRRLAEQKRKRAASCQAQALTLAAWACNLLICCLLQTLSVVCITYERTQAPTEFAGPLLIRDTLAIASALLQKLCSSTLSPRQIKTEKKL